jgi:hypothetical protein
MGNREFQKAQNIIDSLFHDERMLTQWQHSFLEEIISMAAAKNYHPPVAGRKEQFISLIKELINVGMIEEDDIDVEAWVENYLKNERRNINVGRKN